MIAKIGASAVDVGSVLLRVHNQSKHFVFNWLFACVRVKLNVEGGRCANCAHHLSLQLGDNCEKMSSHRRTTNAPKKSHWFDDAHPLRFESVNCVLVFVCFINLRICRHGRTYFPCEEFCERAFVVRVGGLIDKGLRGKIFLFSPAHYFFVRSL